MKSKYIDIASMVQIIGNIYNNPSILDKDDKYKFKEDNFASDFHRIVFGAMYNLYQLGAKSFSIAAIEDYLETRPKAKAEYEVYKGSEYILKCAENADINQFDYYYQRLKKMSLLRAYEDMGMDLSWFYDPDNLDTHKFQEQSEKLDSMSLLEISNLINDKVDAIKMEYVDEAADGSCNMGDGVLDYLMSLREAPALGYPLYGRYINTIFRGARLGKFFLRSGATGVGKTRSMIGDACYFGCSQMYDNAQNKWVLTGACQPTMFIATEQDLQECQSMCIAFIAGVDEEHLLKGEYYSGEWERVEKASQILAQGKIRFECLPDFTMSTVENTIKKGIREYGVEYVFFDYIHSSASILKEVGGNSGVKNLREDNVLFLMSSKLKDIAVQYGVFMMSGTQLNGTFKDSDTPDQTLLRGSKAIADRIDAGMILLDVTADDIEKIQPFCVKNGVPVPNVKMSIYKNRQGRYRSLYLWMNAEKEYCRYSAAFVTDWRYNLIDMEDLKIKVEEESVF